MKLNREKRAVLVGVDSLKIDDRYRGGAGDAWHIMLKMLRCPENEEFWWEL